MTYRKLSLPALAGSVVLLLLGGVLFPAPAPAQQDRGTFTGIVTDPSGGAVPNVAITVRNMATNAIYNSRTNELGQYHCCPN